MNNTYWLYRDLVELSQKYKSVYEKIEEQEGVLDEEIENSLIEVESDYEILATDVINLINNLEDTKIGRNREIKRLQDKNTSVDNQVEFLRKFLITIVKSKGVANKSSNLNYKFNDYSLTVSKRTNYEIGEDFNDPRFIREVIEEKLPAEESNMIKVFLKKRLNIDPKVKQVVLKDELNRECKENGLVEGVLEKEKESILIK